MTESINLKDVTITVEGEDGEMVEVSPLRHHFPDSGKMDMVVKLNQTIELDNHYEGFIDEIRRTDQPREAVLELEMGNKFVGELTIRHEDIGRCRRVIGRLNKPLQIIDDQPCNPDLDAIEFTIAFIDLDNFIKVDNNESKS
jgi:hypothetical protein